MNKMVWASGFVLACLLVLVAPARAGDKEGLRLSGLRNGTVHGPGSAPAGLSGFALVRAFTEACAGVPACASGGFDHIVAGAGLRNAGHATLRLRGAPVTATLVAAYLYVGLIEPPTAGIALSKPPLAGLTFDGVAVSAAQVAAGGFHCWEQAPGVPLPGEASLYRASVTHLIDPLINGEYLLAGVPSGTVDGSDPFRCQAPGCAQQLPFAQGASLVVVFTDPSVPEASAVYLHEAAGLVPLLTGTLVVQQTLLPEAPPQWRSLRFTSIGGDGQTRDPDPVFEPLAPITTRLAFDSLSSLLRGPGSAIEPSEDWSGIDGGTVPQLWDSRTTLASRQELMPSGLPLAPIDHYTVTYQALADSSLDYDCVNPSVHVLSVYADP